MRDLFSSSAMALLLLAAVTSANASKCFTVGQLSGVASHRGESFKADKDGFSNKTFQVLINGKMSIAPDWDTPCTETADNTVICMKATDSTVSVEMWAIDEGSKTVLFSRMRSGFGIYDGGALFAGKVLGSCGLSAPKK